MGGALGPGWQYIQVQDDGTNLNFSVSLDGVNFTKIYSQGRTSYLTNGANQIGLFIDQNTSNNVGAASFDYFRRTQ
jgi:hypothetical protein